MLNRIAPALALGALVALGTACGAPPAHEPVPVPSGPPETTETAEMTLPLDNPFEPAATTSPVAPTPVGGAALEKDGVWIVGDDIAAGTYAVVPDGEQLWGYFARCSNPGCGMESLIDAAVVEGPMTVTIQSSDVAIEVSSVTLVPQ